MIVANSLVKISHVLEGAAAEHVAKLYRLWSCSPEMAENRIQIKIYLMTDIIQHGMEGYSMRHRSLRSQTGTHRARRQGYRDTGVEATALL